MRVGESAAKGKGQLIYRPLSTGMKGEEGEEGGAGGGGGGGEGDVGAHEDGGGENE